VRKIGITLWVVAVILAVGLGAVLLRTDLLAGPQSPSTAPRSGDRAGTPAITTSPPPSVPINVPPTATSLPATSPNASPPDAPASDGPGSDTAGGPLAGGTVNDLYQAFQHAAQQLIGGETDQPEIRSFFSWYQRLSTVYGQAVPLDEAFAWYQQLLGSRTHGNGRLDDAGGPNCSVGSLWRSTCPPVTGGGS
jgi:hypothetical protein